MAGKKKLKVFKVTRTETIVRKTDLYVVAASAEEAEEKISNLSSEGDATGIYFMFGTEAPVRGYADLYAKENEEAWEEVETTETEESTPEEITGEEATPVLERDKV